MGEGREEAKRRLSPRVASIAAVAGLLAAYALATGPLIWMGRYGYLPEWSEPVARALVWPFVRLRDLRVQPLRFLVDWYWGLWLD